MEIEKWKRKKENKSKVTVISDGNIAEEQNSDEWI